jgi:hypothetical protein
MPIMIILSFAFLNLREAGQLAFYPCWHKLLF